MLPEEKLDLAEIAFLLSILSERRYEEGLEEVGESAFIKLLSLSNGEVERVRTGWFRVRENPGEQSITHNSSKRRGK